MKDPFRTTAEVVSCHAIPRPLLSPRWNNAVLELDVRIPGARPRRVKRPYNAPTQNWPQPGEQIPVTVDRADPARSRVRWDDRLVACEVNAEALLAQLAESPPTATPPVRQLRIVGLAKFLRGARQIRATTERFADTDHEG